MVILVSFLNVFEKRNLLLLRKWNILFSRHVFSLVACMLRYCWNCSFQFAWERACMWGLIPVDFPLQNVIHPVNHKILKILKTFLSLNQQWILQSSKRCYIIIIIIIKYIRNAFSLIYLLFNAVSQHLIIWLNWYTTV